MNQIRTFLNTPKGYALAALLLLTVIASFDSKGYSGWINIAAAIGMAVLTDLVFALVQRWKRFYPDGAVLTGLIVALVLSTTVPWYLCGLTAVIASLSKHLLSIKRKPIFNPAAFGLVVAILILGSEQSWWGGFTGLPAWCMAFVIIAGMLVTNRVNKFPMVFAYLGVYFGLFLLFGLLNMSAAGEALRNPFLNAVLFLAFFMLTDPPTSPAKYTDQVLFGVIAAVICVIGYETISGLSFMLIGLLVANGWNAWRGSVR